mmetsp:Transcript_2728/g.4955  ORF Transcript_2728/g.4955 Transcript_2728/m.4955 type:complete len:222 (+) Transcript_2728:163-828(+)
MEANRIMSTCFTFDAMHKVSGDVSLFVISDAILREKAINPVDNRANAGAKFTAGFNSLSQRSIIALTSPVRKDKIKHCTAAEGVILLSKSTGCNLNSPLSISPEATTLSAARTTAKAVKIKPMTENVISPKHARATPMITGITVNFRRYEVFLPINIPKKMINAGTKDRMIWLKLTEVCLSARLPSATFKLNTSENKKMRIRPAPFNLVRVTANNSCALLL